MNTVIKFNKDFEVRFSHQQVSADLYQLSTERVFIEPHHSSKSEMYMSKDQIKQLLDYYIGVYNGIK